MPTAKKDKTISALEVVHAALKTLNAQERQRVLASVHALLEISPSPTADKQLDVAAGMESSSPVSHPLPSARPLAIRELIQDKKPRTHPQLITLFAYFREKHENRPSFSRDDLERYYKASRENPPQNYARDFVKTVKNGWIHEDGENSYITSKGIEAVESGFAGGQEKKPRQGRPKDRVGAKKQIAKKRS